MMLTKIAVKMFGAQPSGENIRRITYEATVYARIYQASHADRREADEQVAIAAKRLRKALKRSAKYHDTYSVLLGSEAERALLNVEQTSQELAKKRSRRGRPTNSQLYRLCDVVLDAYWETNKDKIGTKGIHSRDSGDTRYGPVLEVVKEALILAGMSVPPSDESIRDATSRAVKAKITSI